VSTAVPRETGQDRSGAHHNLPVESGSP
jgi:hypothetical protein